MTDDTPIPSEHTEAAAPRALSALSFTLALGILLAIFVLLNPVWKSSTMSEWDQNIWWSYAAIPLVAAIFLAFEKKLGLPALFLDSMKLTFAKFAITFIASNLFWSYGGVPGTGSEPAAPARGSSELSFTPHEVPASTPLDPASLGSLSGVVRDREGRPVEGALVYIRAGLEEFSFAPPAEPARFTHHGDHVAPPLAVIQVHQLVTVHSESPELHTAVLSTAERNQLLNFPVLPQKKRDLMFAHPHGPTSITCSIHGAKEPPANLIITSNPFYSWTDRNGRFDIDGAPSRKVELATWTTSETSTVQQIEIRAHANQEVVLQLR